MMEEVISMRQDRAALIRKARALLDKAELEKRTLSDEEEREFTQLNNEIDMLGTDVEKREAEIWEVRRAGEEGAPPAGYGGGLFDRSYPESDTDMRIYKPGEEQRYVSDVAARCNLADGIRANDLSLGRALQAMVSGDWSKAPAEMRTMATAPDSAGGYLVPAPLSATIIAMALNKMRVRQGGAQFIAMESKTLTVPRLEALPKPEWLAENAEGNFTDADFGACVLTARKLMVLTSMSIELAEDGQGVNRAVEQALADAIALEFDRAALMGDGGASPNGVYNQAGVQEVEHDGPLSNYSPFSEAYFMLEGANETATGLIMNPRCFGDLDLLTAAPDGQYLKPPASWENYRKLSSNQIPVDLNDSGETVAFMGDWGKLLWGIRTEIRIEATRDTADAFKKGQVWIRAYLRGDVALSRPAAFVKITGIEETPSGGGA